MNILVDAMGGDKAPDAVIEGAVAAIKEIKGNIILIGQEAIINKKSIEKYGKPIKEINPRLSIANATEIIEMEDIPTVAIKTKKDSSMVKGFNMLKNGEGDVFVSAGNSGALLTGATLLIGRIKGIDRPALAGILPGYYHKFVLMDCGANTNCKPINLVQFAQMASIYLTNSTEKKNVKVGLLNIGTEPTKGNELVRNSFLTLQKYSEDLNINFIGNIEGRDAFLGNIDVVVADGFTGNVFLKTAEGIGKLVKNIMKETFKRNIFSKLVALLNLPSLKKVAKEIDYKEHGGALFLGVKQPVVKAHGSSDSKLFKYTIIQAEQFVKDETIDKLKEIYESELNKEKMDEIKKYVAELEMNGKVKNEN